MKYAIAFLTVLALAVASFAQCPNCPQQQRLCPCPQGGRCDCGPLCNCPGVLCQGRVQYVVINGQVFQTYDPVPALYYSAAPYLNAQPLPAGPRVVYGGCPGGVCPR